MFGAFYDRALRPNSDLRDAAAAFSGAVDDLIANDRYFYDLVALDKDGEAAGSATGSVASTSRSTS